MCLEGVQEVRWDRGGTVRAGDCNFLYGITLNRLLKRQHRTVRVCTNWSSINRGFMGNVYCLDQWKQYKLHWVQDPNQSNVDNLNNVRREASRHFRKKEGTSES